MALAARCQLGVLVADQLRLAVKGGAHAAVTIMTLVAGMVAGADSFSERGDPRVRGRAWQAGPPTTPDNTNSQQKDRLRENRRRKGSR
jgi:hypothetical protein